MSQQAVKRNTRLFTGFLLLGGLMHFLDPTENLALNSFLFCAVYTVYTGLILFWLRSVRTRLLPTRARSYICAAGALMILFLALKVFNYRIVGDAPGAVTEDRYSIYAYWIPQMLVPSLFLMTCVRIRRGEAARGKWNERLLLIPGAALSLMVMTSDLHHLVYRPRVELSSFVVQSGTYSYGFGFYLLYAWMIIAWLTGLILLFRETGRRPAGGMARLTGVVLAWAGLLLLNHLVLDRFHLHLPYNSSEIHIFAMIGVLEICIRGRLIPSNENHTGFFAQLSLPVMITDSAFVPVWRTGREITASEDDLRASLKGPVRPREDMRLSGMEIPGGYAFWAADESELHRESRRLAAVNEILSEENDLIRAENELKEKKAHLDARGLVYDRISAAIRPRQERIGALLSGVEPGTEAFRRVLGECCVLNAWCKRKGNLLLLDERTLPKRNRELFLALQESARFLKYCGAEAAAVGEETSDFTLPEIHALYDTFETVIEAWIPFLRRMTVSLMSGGIRLAAETEGALPLPETALPVERTESDGVTFLTVTCRKGGEPV